MFFVKSSLLIGLDFQFEIVQNEQINRNNCRARNCNETFNQRMR